MAHRQLVLVAFAAAVSLAAVPAPAQDTGQIGLTAFEGVAVATADRVDVSRLTEAGTVSIEGARGLVVTVAGELRGRAEREGKVGVMLIPDIPFFTNLYRNRRILLSAVDFSASVAAGDSGFFTSKSKYSEAGFSRYRVLVFNTTGAPVSANIYVYQSRN